jgi:transcription elongation factor Elf1
MRNFLKNIWRQIRVWLINVLSNGLEDEKNELSRKKAVQDFKEKFSRPGLDCPKCGVLISIDFKMLLNQKPIECPNCHLILEVNKEQSNETLEVLEDIATSEKEINKIKSFKI